jgi:hypothetical protein
LLAKESLKEEKKTEKPAKEPLSKIFLKEPPKPENIETTTIKKTKIIIVGCGSRGNLLSQFIKQNEKICKLVTIAEPRKKIQSEMEKKFNLKKIFSDFGSLVDFIVERRKWKEVDGLVLKEEEEEICYADMVYIATQDSLHVEPCLLFSDLKINVLLEKPFFFFLNLINLFNFFLNFFFYFF